MQVRGIIFIATSFYVAQLVFAAGDYSIVMKVPYYTMNNANTPTGTFESKFNFNDQNYISVKSVKYSVGAALQQPIDARSTKNWDSPFVVDYKKYQKDLEKYEEKLEVYEQLKLIRFIKNADEKLILRKYKITKK
jgi:hypothetical protein